MWILVTAGILENVLVIVWRFSKRELRLNTLSVLIVSLAMADLYFCIHYLLQEVMLLDPIFNSRNRSLLNLTSTDERLCLSIKFFLGVSANASTLTAVAIALYTFCLFYHCRHGTRWITGFILVSWIACLISGAVSTWQFKEYYTSPETAIDVERLSMLVIFGCVDSDNPHHPHYVTIVVTINAVSSLVVAILYLYLWLKIRKSPFLASRECEDKVKQFQFRLIVISILNLVCWWPACILYLFSIANNVAVYDGRSARGRCLSPVVTQPILIVTATVTVINPVIYTLASKRFLKCTCRDSVMHGCCRKDRLIIRPGYEIMVDGGCCAVCCPDPVESEVTENSSLFSD